MPRYQYGNIVKIWMLDTFAASSDNLKSHIMNKHKFSEEQYEEYKNIYMGMLANDRLSSALNTLNDDAENDGIYIVKAEMVAPIGTQPSSWSKKVESIKHEIEARVGFPDNLRATFAVIKLDVGDQCVTQNGIKYTFLYSPYLHKFMFRRSNPIIEAVWWEPQEILKPGLIYVGNMSY